MSDHTSLLSVDLDDNHYAGGHGADDVDFQEDFVWNANSMSSIKEELTAASWDAATHQVSALTHNFSTHLLEIRKIHD